MQKEELYISYITKEVAISGTTTSDNDFKLIDAGALFLTGNIELPECLLPAAAGPFGGLVRANSGSLFSVV